MTGSEKHCWGGPYTGCGYEHLGLGIREEIKVCGNAFLGGITSGVMPVVGDEIRDTGELV